MNSLAWINRAEISLFSLSGNQPIPMPDLAYSEISVIGKLIRALPEPCALHLANSSTVRYAQLFTVPPQVEICCNRGVNGIEGSLSTAIGYAAASSFDLK